MSQGSQPATTLDDGIVATAEACLETVGQAREAVHRVIFGQEQVVDLSLITILAGGHGLLVGHRHLGRVQHRLACLRAQVRGPALPELPAFPVARGGPPGTPGSRR